ncbi:MAG: hypothetical protein COZ34_02455 [Candidatus Pacebacteria bacterium CG_4_10_14_3_um_filter_34_15]|nr:hypothetical protein [Candidatus Pacearchaeota archaeon]NCQ65610.1 hypothetical protein [Candidatus Paceibacterota bacterium]OIO44904.1 MAG: hypothetical protein AUJ41_01455 [Candidatus Pacebacteria bacterium CG1_02_43_31]PIQ80533.1 MAG: hypothetical protein COV78_05050 [Candidatus Pacebacteria bacterium CG11_big_fil_rev_8_21_14_0_20_34_55]PIX81579.1 MAG: hypothetical protein COZ34_02455 [Candidatus Pacebacteria bacterium CG_4_10_14_3_um_filter_34_15]PJC44168.1 MAG: hypothetical protein CO0
MIKIKLLLFISMIIFLGLLISRTSSFYFDSVKGANNIMKLTEWKPAESKLEIIKDDLVYSIEENIVDQNPTIFLQNLTTQENQYLSFQYKIESDEDALGFDDPNFILSINNDTVFTDNVNPGIWQRTFINLKDYKSNDGRYLIDFITKNTFDEIKPPSLYIQEISTAKFLAKKNDLLKFNISKSNSKLHLKYSVDENGAIVSKHQILLEPFEFLVSEQFLNNEVEYYSVDSFGNVENSKYATIYTDFTLPNKIEELNCFNESDQELSITFTAPHDDFSNQPILYESAISSTEVLESTDWNLLEQINPVNFKKFGVSNLSSNGGALENLLFQNINPEKNYFSIKSIDQAGNISEISSCFR